MNTIICPITQLEIVDPVIDREGNTYEKSAIETWLQTHNISPITRNPMSISDLVPNRALISNNSNNSNNSSNENSSKCNRDTNLTVTYTRIRDTRGDEIFISIPTPSTTERIPVDVCVVVDISGSMDNTSFIKNNDGIKQENGFTVLDIVKHATSTIASSLNENDRFSLVSFSDTGRIELPLTSMNESNRNLALTRIKNLSTQGCTNLWDGIKKGLSVFQGQQNERIQAVFVLTDGVPNIGPARGIETVLTEYINEFKFNGIINTFGFGYELDSKLLHEIACIGDGTFAFIPDAGMMGTIFINAMSNLLCTMGTRCTVEYENRKLLVGPLLFSQSKNVRLLVPNGKKLCFSFTPWFSNTRISIPMTNIHLNNTDNDIIDRVNRFKKFERYNLVDFCYKSQDGGEDTPAPVLNDPDLQYDYENQVKLAKFREYYNTWGKHYLLSFARTHTLQQCNNFKDRSIQQYGSSLFNELRLKIDKIFESLPTPNVSRVTRDTVRITNMSTYNTASNGCYSGDSWVIVDGVKKLVRNVKKGDILDNGATVVCVLRSPYPEKMVKITGGDDTILTISLYHPIFWNGKWEFPMSIGDIFSCKKNSCTYSDTVDTCFVYSFVLDSIHTVNVCNVKTVTLGHSFTDPIVAHPFFGSDLVVQEMKRIGDYDSGLVSVLGCIRNENDLVCGFI